MAELHRGLLNSGAKGCSATISTQKNSNHPGSDARIDVGAIGRFEISVRTLTHSGIKFKKSKDIGSGRSATQSDVYNAISGVEVVVVVDIRAGPEKVESVIAPTRGSLIQAVCWLGGQQRWGSPTRMT